MTQSEKPGITPAELCATLGMPASAAAGTKVSGGQFENFRKGWAVNIMASVGKAAHWFERDGFDAARALCSKDSEVRWLYGPSNYGRCQNCIKVMSRRIKRGPPL